MAESFIILFRETLEAALVIGVVLATLKRFGIKGFHRPVYIGIVLGISASIAGAFLFSRFAGGFTGKSEQILEGFIMLTGAVLLTTMIFWMMKNTHSTKKIEKLVMEKIGTAGKFELLLLVFTAILREGIEAVLFLSAARFASGNSNLTGAVLGMLSAVIFSFFLMAGSLRLNLKLFFTVINLTLILFASGLFASGIHELQEAGLIPVVMANIYNINPPLNLDGIYPLFHEKGYIGSIAKGLFGYDGNPTLIQLIGYTVYIFWAAFVWKKISRDRQINK